MAINANEKNVENLNNATSFSDLYFVVVKNDNTINADLVFDTFYKNIFVNQIAPLISEKLVLECTQVQNFWPNKAVGALDIRSYNEAGQCSEDEKISPKSFLLTFSSSLTKSSKNAFTFGIPDVVAKFKKAQEFNSRKESFIKLKHFLTNFISLGPLDNPVFALVVPTTKTGSISPFVPVTECSVVGFSANSRKSVKFRSVSSP